MDLEFQISEKIDSFEQSNKMRPKTSERISYEAEVEIIKKQIGDIENIRFRLGLSARKMAQLLLVDPSAWTRWTKKITPVPPHIYRSLQWYLTLQEKNPGFTPQVFLASHWYSSTKREDLKSLEVEPLLSELNFLKNRLNQIEAVANISDLSSRSKNKIFVGFIFLSLLIGFLVGFFFNLFYLKV